MRKAKGTETPSGKRQIAVTFDQKLFDQIAEEADRVGRPFTTLVRAFVRMGLKKAMEK